MSQNRGIEVLTVTQAAGIDRHYGLQPSPIDDLTLMLLIKDIQPR